MFLQAGRKARLRNVDQQARHLGLAGQLAQHRAEGALDLRQLLPVGLEIRGLALLLVEGLPQGLLFGLGLAQVLEIADD